MQRRWILCLLGFILLTIPISAQRLNLPTDICDDDVVTPSEATILEEIKAIHNATPYSLHDTSPSCRFVIVMFDVSNNERQFIAWNVYGGDRLFDYVRPRQTNYEVPIIHWNTQESEVLVGAWHDSVYPGFDRASGPYHLWKLDGSSVVVMRCDTACVTPSFQSVTWDDSRNWLWTPGWSGAVAYNRETGQVARSFYNPPWDGGLVEPGGGHGYRFSDDGTHVIVASTSSTVDTITVWNIDRYIPFAVNAKTFVPLAFDLSPDNRYLALGFRAIRVWDLKNLASVYEDRLPIYRHEGPFANIAGLRFVDETTIETRSAEGIQLWDLHTGELISSENE